MGTVQVRSNRLTIQCELQGLKQQQVSLHVLMIDHIDAAIGVSSRSVTLGRRKTSVEDGWREHCKGLSLVPQVVGLKQQSAEQGIHLIVTLLHCNINVEIRRADFQGPE